MQVTISVISNKKKSLQISIKRHHLRQPLKYTCNSEMDPTSLDDIEDKIKNPQFYLARGNV